MVLTATLTPTKTRTEDRLTKTTLVAAVAEKAGISKTEAKRVLDTMLAIISESLAKDVKVSITGFGSFETRTSKARNGVNPRTGEKIVIPATKRPVFTAGAPLKRAVKGDVTD